MSDAPHGHQAASAGHAHACGHDHGAHAHGQGKHGAAAANVDGADRVKDPVCGMMVDPHTTKHRAEHDGHPYYFCSNGCRTKFEASPVRYVDPGQAVEDRKSVV